MAAAGDGADGDAAAEEEEKQNRTPLETRLDEMRAAGKDPAKQKARKASLSFMSKMFDKMSSRPEDTKARRLRVDNPLVKKFITSVGGAEAFCREAGFRDVESGKKTFFEIPDGEFRPELAAEAARLLTAALNEAAEEQAKPAAAEAPRKCANNCGFYGTSKTEYLCSGCYNKKYEIGGPSQRSTGADGCVEKCGNFGSPKFGGMCSECYRKKNKPKTRREKWAAARVKMRAVVRFRMGAPERAVQEKKNRCWECKKKIGVSGIECRCGYVFCGKHRYASEHDCRFNYVREQQRKLLRENPTLTRDKMDKL